MINRTGIGMLMIGIERLRKAGAFGTSRSEKFGRAITSLPPELLSSSVSLYLGRTYLRPADQRVLHGLLTKWIFDGISSIEANARAQEYASNLKGSLNARDLFLVSQILGGLGLFTSGLTFEKMGRAEAKKWTDVSITSKNSVKKLRAHFFGEGSGSMSDDLARFERKMSGKLIAGGSLASIRGYARAILGDDEPLSGMRENAAQRAWVSELANKNILVIGPGRLVASDIEHSKYDFVVRTLGTAGLDWNRPDDPAPGRADLVYLNAENQRHYLSKVSEDARARTQIRWLCVKRGIEEVGHPGVRRIDSGGELFHRGHANLVPLICADLAQVEGTNIHVIGASFFADKLLYRPSTTQNPRNGSPAGRFDKSTVIASHNPFQNLAIVRNLVEVRRVTGDKVFEQICNSSEDEYAKRLDSLYG